MSYHIVLGFFKVPFTKILSQKDQLEKDSLHTSNERKVVSEIAILAQKWAKIALKKKVDLWVFANHPAVHSGGVSRGRVRGGGCWH